MHERTGDATAASKAAKSIADIAAESGFELTEAQQQLLKKNKFFASKVTFM